MSFKWVRYQRSVREKFLKNLTGLHQLVVGKGNDSLTKLQITDPADLSLTRQCWGEIYAVMVKVMKEASK